MIYVYIFLKSEQVAQLRAGRGAGEKNVWGAVEKKILLYHTINAIDNQCTVSVKFMTVVYNTSSSGEYLSRSMRPLYYVWRSLTPYSILGFPVFPRKSFFTFDEIDFPKCRF
jgi:hypothetical protein